MKWIPTMLLSLLLAGNALAADCLTIKFKDTEYGHRYTKGMGWSIWRKPVTAKRATAIKRASVAYLKVPEAMQSADSGFRTLGGAMKVARWTPEGVKVYANDESRFEHVVALIVSPVGISMPGLVRHKRRDMLAEPLVVKEWKDYPGLDYAVYLLVTNSQRLSLPPRRRPHWRNYRAGWNVNACKTDRS